MCNFAAKINKPNNIMTSLINDILSLPLWFFIPLGVIYLALLAYLVYILWHYRRKNALALMLIIAALASGQSAGASVVTGMLLGDATNGYYVNMPTSNKNNTPWPTINLQTLLDNGVTSLTVYDDGGKDGNYSNQCNGYLILQAPTGYRLRFSGTITSENGSRSDELEVFNGTSVNYTNTVFVNMWSTTNGEPTPFGPYTSSGNEVLVTFYSYGSPAYAGFEMTVDLVDATQPFAITKTTATGGSIETTVGGLPVTQTTMDQTVTVTASPESGYWLSDISVGIDGSILTVPALGGDFISNTATFTMPAAAVTVTPTFTTDPAELYVKMPASDSWTRQIPTGITSFKVYDDGGATGSYSKYCNGSLTLTAPENCVLMLTGSIATDLGSYFYVFNGTSVLTYKDAINTVRYSTTDGEVTDIGTLISTGRSLTLQFKSLTNTTRAGLDLTATVIDATHAYAITIDPNLANGSIAPRVGGSAANSATVNQIVTLTVTPANSFSATEVSYTVGTTKYVIEPDNGTYSFTMPAGDVTVSAKFLDEVAYLWGEDADGTAEHPYVIRDKAGWDLLVAKSTSYNYTNDKYFELAADISGVTQSVLYFGGHLDGKGHKITLAINNITGYNGFGLIWRLNRNCYISNLTVDGSIVNKEQYVGGFIAQASFSATFTNCRSSVAITSSYSGEGFMGGGFVGFTGGHTITVNRCVFDGSFSSSNDLTFSPWVGGIHNKVTNSAYLYDGEAHFYNDVGNGNFVAYHLTLNNYATVVRTDGTTIGNNTGAVYNISGFTLDGNEYYMPNTTVTLGSDLPSGYSLMGYSTSTGYTFTGNTFPMPNNGVTVTAHIARTDYVNHWQASMTIDGTTAAKAYVITTTDGLNLLASEVSSDNEFAGTFFRLDKDITYSHETAWNDDTSKENNFNGIGGCRKTSRSTKLYSFQGTFDGGDHTISGLRIFRDIKSDLVENYVGLFGYVKGGTVKNIVLADARITGEECVGGIVGFNEGTVSGCTAKSDVTIFARQDGSNNHGGIVGDNAGTVSGCTSSASVTAKGDISVNDYGGIVGYNQGTISGCIAAGVVIANVTDAGAIVGSNSTGTISGNTYHSSLVGSYTFNIGVGSYATGATTFTHGDHTGASLDNSKLWLFDNRDNSPVIKGYAATYNSNSSTAYNAPHPTVSSLTVTLKGRTLYKDGDWNTLCLPFDVSNLTANGPLKGATAMELDTEGTYDTDKKTGFDATTGTLTLNFKPVTGINQKKPYIIKWESGNDIFEPTFSGIDGRNLKTLTASSTGITSQDGNVTFCGTDSPVTWTEDNRSILFLGTSNTLYYPQSGAHVNAFRAYFELSTPDGVREFNLNFDEQGTQTVIGHTEILRPDGSKRPEVERTDSTDKADAAWYSINGVKLDGKPTSKGLYIHGGRKTVVK